VVESGGTTAQVDRDEVILFVNVSQHEDSCDK
jgi:hypothetical protein